MQHLFNQRSHLNVPLTPWEKFQSLPQAKAFLKAGVEMVERIARAHSDPEFAQLLQRRKTELFRSFAQPSILG